MAKEQTREKILDAAMELFATKGYTDSTTKIIADHAKVNEITVFRHFNSKENLFSEVTKNYVSKVNFLERLDKFYNLPVPEAIEKISMEYVNYSFGNLLLFKITLRMHDDMKSEYKLRLTKEYSTGLTKYLNFLEKNGYHFGDTQLIARTHLASLLGLFTVHSLRSESSEVEIREMANLLIKNFLKAYDLN